ncbi:MAG: hypothetical protein ACPLY7_00895 [Microgenomates group bacterium]
MGNDDLKTNNDLVVNVQTEDFLNLESLVKTYVAKIAELEKELRTKSQILTDALENDVVYHEQAEKVKEANKLKSATKQQILKSPQLAEISERIKEIKFDLQDGRAILSDYLQQYQKQTGATQIEVGDGEVLEIVSVVKLVKKSARS